MSVNNVNSIYQTQGMTGAQSGTPIVQIEENETNIGALLLGGAAVIATGAAICAGRGKKVSGDQGFLENICNGFKSLFSKNGDEVAEAVGNAVTKSADEVTTAAVNAVTKSADEVADGVKKYVDLDDVASLTDSQKIKKAQDVLEAAQNNLTVSNKKALKHMENIENITNSLYKKGNDGSLTLIDKMDDTVFATINGTKGLEGAFKLKDGTLIIQDANKFNAYFGKRNTNFTTKANNDHIDIQTLAELFKDTSNHYKIKHDYYSTTLNSFNNYTNVISDDIDTWLTDNDIKALVNREADFKSLKDNQFYKDNTGLLQERVKAAGYDESTSLFERLFKSNGGGSITSPLPTTQPSTSSRITQNIEPPCPNVPAPIPPTTQLSTSSIITQNIEPPCPNVPAPKPPLLNNYNPE